MLGHFQQWSIISDFGHIASLDAMLAGKIWSSNNRRIPHIYPACRFDSVVVGRFSLPSLAIGEVTMSGKQMCLAACVANAVCTHVSYKQISGKCLLFPETAAVDQSSDEMMNTYMLVHFGVPTDCVPPTAGISRSKDVMFIIKAFSTHESSDVN